MVKECLIVAEARLRWRISCEAMATLLASESDGQRDGKAGAGRGKW